MRAIGLAILFTLPALANWAEPQTGNPVQGLRADPAAHPAEAGILDALGQAEMRGGRYRSAKTYFEKASHASEDNGVALANLAQACFVLGEYRRAEQLLRGALSKLPESGDAWHLLGQVLYQRRLYTEAESSFRKALAIDNDALVWSDLAAIALVRHEVAQAEQWLRMAIVESLPGQGRARVRANLALLQWKRGARQEAAAGFREALDEMTTAVGPNHPEISVILDRYAEVLRTLGRKDEAKRAAARAVEIHHAFDAQGNRTQQTVEWTPAARVVRR